MINIVIKFLHLFRILYWRIIKPTSLGVRCIVSCNNKFILVQSKIDFKWYLPGGKVEKGESIYDGIKRELKEEINVSCKDIKQLNYFFSNNEYKNDHIFLFHLELDHYITKSNDSWEINKIALFDPKELPDSTSVATKKRLHEFINEDVSDHRIW